MSRFSDVIAALRGKAAAKASTGYATQLVPLSKPPTRGTAELLRSFRTSPWNRAVVSRIAGDLSAVKWHLQRGEGDKARRVEAHPFLDLLARPNWMLAREEVVQLVQAWREQKGEAFVVIERGPSGVPVELWPVPPHWILETPTQSKPFFRGSHGTWQRDVPVSDMIWLRDPDLEEPYLRGSGIAESLGDEIDTDEYASKQAKGFFFNNAMPGVLVSVEGASDDQLAAAKEKYEASHRGFWNAFRSLWTGSKIEVTRLDTNFKDQQLVELRAALRDTIIQVWGVPPEKLGIVTNSNRATIESADFLFAKGILLPRLGVWHRVWNELLAQFPGAEGLSYEYENPVPEDRAFRLQAMQASPGAFTRNEIRALVGMAELAEGGDEPLASAPVAGVGPIALEADPVWAKSLPERRKGPPPAADGAFGPDAIPNLLEALRPERLIRELQPVFEGQIEMWARSQLDALGAAGRFDILNPLITPFLRDQAGERITGLVNETTRQSIRDTLTEGVQAGESIDDLMDRVERVFTVATEARAQNIARTEVLRASNWATLEAQKASGVVSTREWVATRDGRVRPEHLALDGKQADLSQQFEVEGYSALYPGGFGAPEMDCQCRCTTVAVIDDDLDSEELSVGVVAKGFARVRPGHDKAELDRVWKAYDEALVPWELEAQAALRRGFGAQKMDLRRAMRAAARGG